MGSVCCQHDDASQFVSSEVKNSSDREAPPPGFSGGPALPRVAAVTAVSAKTAAGGRPRLHLVQERTADSAESDADEADRRQGFAEQFADRCPQDLEGQATDGRFPRDVGGAGQAKLQDIVGAPEVSGKDKSPQKPVIDPGGMVLTFKCLDGTMRKLVATHRPLGVDFHRSNPIVMKNIRPGSVGESLGVQVGWEIHAVNGEDVSEKPFEYTFGLLKEASAVLPSRDV